MHHRRHYAVIVVLASSLMAGLAYFGAELKVDGNGRRLFPLHLAQAAAHWLTPAGAAASFLLLGLAIAMLLLRPLAD